MKDSGRSKYFVIRHSLFLNGYSVPSMLQKPNLDLRIVIFSKFSCPVSRPSFVISMKTRLADRKHAQNSRILGRLNFLTRDRYHGEVFE